MNSLSAAPPSNMKKARKYGLEIGRDDWIRTSDPLTPSQVRYQAAPHPEIQILGAAENLDLGCAEAAKRRRRTSA
jgi:hypothetical protein